MHKSSACSSFVAVFDVLCGKIAEGGGGQLNTEIQKSEQTVFAQISLSQY